MSLTDHIQNGAKELLPATTNMRRHLHRHPELSFYEKETSEYVQRVLDDIGIPYRADVGGYGVVAMVESPSTTGAGADTAHPVVALRADMDALPITEESGLEFSSVRSGVMHACGHDVHTSSLLCAARILWDNRNELPGSVKLLFQPAEERLPGGAQAMIRDGALDNPRPSVILGQHINPDLPSGMLGFRSGVFMASVDDIYITVHGSGGHAAYPHRLNDPVLAASEIVVALQQLVSRRTRPDIPAVLSIGKFHADGANNIIPRSVELAGTFRTVDESYRAEARKEIKRIAEMQARAYGVEAEVELVEGYPSLPNDPDVTSRLQKAAVRYYGEHAVHDLPLYLGGEDFAYYANQLPACFFNLGTTNFAATGSPAPLHSPYLVVDESCLEFGASFLCLAAVEELRFLAGQ